MNNLWKTACPKAAQIFKDDILPVLKQNPVFFPSAGNIFRAFDECPPEEVKVVWLLQDPYYDGSANGLCTDNNYKVDGSDRRSSAKSTTRSPSLMKILKEISQDVGWLGANPDGREDFVHTSWLQHLPSQGVLLWNTALTVEPDKPGSHIDLWAPFTEEIIKYLNTRDNIVWMLWGNYAKAYKEKITNSTHYIIEGTHPAARPNVKVPFAGGKYFSRCNEFLTKTQQSAIRW